MNFKEFLKEWSSTAPGIKSYLQRKGYKFLKAGVDQSAYLEPKTGRVLKIFGTQTGSKKTGETEDQKMFKFWASYCAAHKSNEFLPQFDGWKSFEYDGEHYLQIRMEKLQKLPQNLADCLEKLASNAKHNADRKAYKKSMDAAIGQHRAEFLDDDWGDEFEMDKGPLDQLNQLVILLGKQQFDLLWDTMCKLEDISAAKGWIFDLHGGNFMHRNDGIPVIVDPWVCRRSGRD